MRMNPIQTVDFEMQAHVQSTEAEKNSREDYDDLRLQLA